MYVLHGICYSLSDLFSSVKQALGSSTSLELTQIRFFLWLSNIPLYAAAAAKSLQLCSTLWGPRDCSPPGSSIHGIIQARILEWVASLFSRGSSLSRDGIGVFCIAGRCVSHHESSLALSLPLCLSICLSPSVSLFLSIYLWVGQNFIWDFL